MATTIHLEAGDYTKALQKRTLGKFNAGFYCSQCGEFVALAVRDQSTGLEEPQYSGNEPIEFTCPFCGVHQRPLVSELQTLVLTEANKRKRPKWPEPR